MRLNRLQSGFALLLATGLSIVTLLAGTADARTKFMDVPASSENIITQGFTTTNTGLNYKDIVVGTGAEAKAGKDVKVAYTGWLYPQGTQFDSSEGKGPYAFRLGTHSVIQGWDEGLAGMKVGGKRILVIPPQLGYGKQGYPGTIIKPNATLKFEVELVDVQ